MMYVVARFENEKFDILAIDDNFSYCETVVANSMRDSDDVVTITELGDCRDDLKDRVNKIILHSRPAGANWDNRLYGSLKNRK